MRRAEIEQQNRAMLQQQRQFRMAVDVVTEAFAAFAEVQAVAVIGSVAKALWKEVPRFYEFRRARIEVWHELTISISRCGWTHRTVWERCAGPWRWR